jgi:hypothetical protein
MVKISVILSRNSNQIYLTLEEYFDQIDETFGLFSKLLLSLHEKNIQFAESNKQIYEKIQPFDGLIRDVERYSHETRLLAINTLITAVKSGFSQDEVAQLSEKISFIADNSLDYTDSLKEEMKDAATDADSLVDLVKTVSHNEISQFQALCQSYQYNRGVVHQLIVDVSIENRFAEIEKNWQVLNKVLDQIVQRIKWLFDHGHFSDFSQAELRQEIDFSFILAKAALSFLNKSSEKSVN